MNYPIIEAWQGNETQLATLFKSERDGTPINLTGAIAKCLIKRKLSDADSDAVIYKSTENGGIVIADPVGGILVLILKESDTKPLPINVREKFFCTIAVKYSTAQISCSATFHIRFNQGAINDFETAGGEEEGEVSTPGAPGSETSLITASEPLSAGDFVNVFDYFGSPRVRKATAAVAGREAHGYVIAAASAESTATVLFEGANSVLSGVTAGIVYLGETIPGGFTSIPPSSSGQIIQRIGLGVSSTTINFEAQTPITLA